MSVLCWCVGGQCFFYWCGWLVVSRAVSAVCVVLERCGVLLYDVIVQKQAFFFLPSLSAWLLDVAKYCTLLHALVVFVII